MIISSSALLDSPTAIICVSDMRLTELRTPPPPPAAGTECLPLDVLVERLVESTLNLRQGELSVKRSELDPGVELALLCLEYIDAARSQSVSFGDLLSRSVSAAVGL